MNFPLPAPDHQPAGNDNTTPNTSNDSDGTTETRDAGMYEAGTPTAIERRLIHVDRVTEETLVNVRASNGQQLALIGMVVIVGAMVYLVHRQQLEVLAVLLEGVE